MKKRAIRMVVLTCAVLFLSGFMSPQMSYWHTYSRSWDRWATSDHAPVHGIWPHDMIAHMELATREEGLEVEGRIPTLTDAAGHVGNRINNVIDRAISSKIADARDSRASLLIFDFDFEFSAPYMSIILKSTAENASSKTEVTSINFNVNTGEQVSAADIVGSHVVLLADRLLVEMIRRNPERYNPSFSGMRRDQAFTVTDWEIVFWFDEFQLAPGSQGIVPLSLRLDQIYEVRLSRYEYRIRPGFNLKMIPVRTVGQLGYTYRWIDETQQVNIYHNGELVITLTPDENNYVREHQHRFVRSLEAAPELVDTTTYVPISFFDQILSLVAYSIDANDNITFASYPVSDDWFNRR